MTQWIMYKGKITTVADVKKMKLLGDKKVVENTVKEEKSDKKKKKDKGGEE